MTATVIPLGLEQQTRLGIAAERQTFTALLPRGLTLSTDKHRFLRTNGSILRVLRAQATSGDVVATLEVTQ